MPSRVSLSRRPLQRSHTVSLLPFTKTSPETNQARGSDMDPEALMRINAQEERFLPVEIKVKMLMEQASMRMRASTMVGERISMLDDVIRVRALLAIIRQGRQHLDRKERKVTLTPRQETRATASSPAASVTNAEAPPCAEEPGESTSEVHLEEDDATAARVSDEVLSQPKSERFVPCGKADMEMFTRMAVSALKTVLFQLAEEGTAEGAKDLSAIYEGLVTTEALSEEAAEGFPALDVDSLLDLKHARYRKVVVSRHRFLLRKLGVLLDMDDGLDKLLELAEETDLDATEEEMADVPLQQLSPSTSPKQVVASVVEKDVEGSSRPRVGSVGSLAARAMSTLQNTSWESSKAGPGSDGTTEDETSGETDEETPQPQHGQSVQVSPSRRESVQEVF